jgi:hypothetical protein
MSKTLEIIVGIIFLFFAFLLFDKAEYGLSVILVLALVVLLKSDKLTELAFSLSDGLHAKFQLSPEKIEGDIRENEELVTHKNFASFKRVEEKVLAVLQKRYGGEMKTQIHFMFGLPNKPEFRYTPDATLQTADTLYFFEIKYVLKPELARKIVGHTATYLKTAYDAFVPSAEKRMVMKLILVSEQDIDISNIAVPAGIELEFFKLQS